MKKILFVSFSLFISTILSSCTKDRLENYFVQAEKNPDYFVMSMPSSVIEIDKSELDKNTLTKIESLKKINLLLYKPSKQNKNKFSEYRKVEKILNTDDYKKLFIINNEGRKLEFVYQGEPNSIEKISFLGRDSSGNFMLGFVKAKNLSMDALVKTLKKIKRVDNHHINEFIEELNKKPLQ